MMSTQRSLYILLPAVAHLLLASATVAQDVSVWAYEPEAVAGVYGGPTEFESIDGLAVGPGGTLYVADNGARVVRVLDGYSLLQKFVIGREGSGPGEFRSIRRVTVVRDTLYVFDGVLRRLSMFAPDRNFVTSFPSVPVTIRGFVTEALPETRLADGSLLMTTAPVGQGSAAATFLVRAQGDTAAELARLHWGDASRRIRTGRLRTLVKQPVEEISAWAPGPNGSWVAVLHRPLPEPPGTARPRLLLVSNQGDTIRNVLLPARQEPISEASARAGIAAVAEEYAYALRSLGASPMVVREAFEENLKLPEFQSPFDKLLVGHGGSLWLREGAFGKESARWRILDSRGEVIAHANLPTQYTVLAVHSDRIFATTAGRYGEPILIMLRRTEAAN